MWDYDKLFAEGNIVGLKNLHNNKIYNHGIPNKNCWGDTNEVDWYCFENNNLKRNMLEIQYIIRLDEHGNVIEKLFDRERDMKPEAVPMPELKDGMFIRVAFKNNYLDQNLGFVNLSQGRIIYQEGGYDWVNNIKTWKEAKIIEIYDPGALSFHFCRYTTPIWRSPEYQTYLDSKN